MHSRGPSPQLEGEGSMDRRKLAEAASTRQQPVGESGADTTAIEIDNAALLAARKDDTPAKRIPALVVDQAGA